MTLVLEMCWPHSIQFESKVTIHTFLCILDKLWTVNPHNLLWLELSRNAVHHEYLTKMNGSAFQRFNHPKGSKQAPPEPKSRMGPEMMMLISIRGKKNIPARVLLDSGYATPIASQKQIEEHNVPFVSRNEQEEIQNFAEDTVDDCGWCYTFPITCQHGNHSSKETFKIGRMEESRNVMLQYWWIITHKAKGFADGGKFSFESAECKRTCTKHNCHSFTIDINETILDFGNDPWWIGIIGNLDINNKDEMEIDWIDDIPSSAKCILVTGSLWEWLRGCGV